eukprot:1144059-Pelagomonas_calceolata.AAC.2
MPAGAKEREEAGNSKSPKHGNSPSSPMEAPTPTSSPSPITPVFAQRSVEEAADEGIFDGTKAFRKLWSRLQEQGKSTAGSFFGTYPVSCCFASARKKHKCFLQIQRAGKTVEPHKTSPSQLAWLKKECDIFK